MRHLLVTRWQLLQRTTRVLLQAALGTCAAWIIAHDLLGHTAPIFAPITALIAIGAVTGQPWRRAIEISLGVSFGVLVADVVVNIIGHGAWQIGVLVLLAMGASTIAGGSPTFVMQAGISAVLIAALPTATKTYAVERVVDTLVGGAVAFVIAVVLLPVRPVKLVQEAAEPLLEQLAATLEDIADALEADSRDEAVEALHRARSISETWVSLHDAVAVGTQAARIAPARWHESADVNELADSAAQIDLAIRNVRVLARVALRLIELEDSAASELALPVRLLGRAVRELDERIAGRAATAAPLREAALSAARIATEVYERTGTGLMDSQLVGQVRMTCVDLLRASGMTRAEAITAVTTVAGDDGGAPKATT